VHIAFCDDQPEERRAVENLLHLWQQKRGCALHFRVFRNATELLEAAEKERFSLYLLDIMMQGVSGMAAAREIRSFDKEAAIVFLTSSPGFAYESYGVHAMDYLLKPITAELLFPVLDRIMAQKRKSQDSLTLKCGTALVRVPFSQISYVEVMGKHLYFNLTDGTVREVYGALSEYTPLLLAHEAFVHTHRSYVVNLWEVAELSSAGLRTFAGKLLPVSRRMYPEVQQRYVAMFFSDKE